MTPSDPTGAKGLEPCPVPWCEQNDPPHTWQDCSDEWVVICPSCGVNGPIGRTEDEAVDEWSALTRSDTPAPATDDVREVLRNAARHITSKADSFGWDTADHEALEELDVARLDLAALNGGSDK